MKHSTKELIKILRKGPGRPKKEPTKVMRVPVSKVEAVKKIIKGLEVTIQVKTKP